MSDIWTPTTALLDARRTLRDRVQSSALLPGRNASLLAGREALGARSSLVMESERLEARRVASGPPGGGTASPPPPSRVGPQNAVLGVIPAPLAYQPEGKEGQVLVGGQAPATFD